MITGVAGCRAGRGARGFVVGGMWLASSCSRLSLRSCCLFFFFQAEDGIRDLTVTGVQTCALPISLRGTAPVIFGDGAQTRDFTFVTNVVDANLLACQAPTDKVAGEVFNIGCGVDRKSVV